MIYAYVPCICFEAIAINRPDLCYKQLGLEKTDLHKLHGLARMKLKQQSKFKGKNWKKCNKTYMNANRMWTERNQRLVQKDFQFEGRLINDEDADVV